MSRVTNVILAYELCDTDRDQALLAEINALVPRGALVHIEDSALPVDWFVRDRKTIEVNVAIGVFNFLDHETWAEAIRAQVDFDMHGCDWAQMFVCGQESMGFELIELHRAF